MLAEDGVSVGPHHHHGGMLGDDGGLWKLQGVNGVVGFGEDTGVGAEGMGRRDSKVGGGGQVDFGERERGWRV